MSNLMIPAASLLLLRTDPFSVLMGKRNEGLVFGANHWVFPGGRIDDTDHTAVTGLSNDPLAAARHAALREAREETAIDLDVESNLHALVPLARWIAPAGTSRRFDTWFFLGEAPADAVPEADGSEIIEVAFVEPTAMLLALEREEVELLPPTVLNLRWLAAAGSAAGAFKQAATRIAPLVEPEHFRRNGEAYIRIAAATGYDIREYHMPSRKKPTQSQRRSEET